MSKALETGKTLAEQILSKLPEGLRGTVSTAFAAPEATDALTLLGDSALARSDYSKAMDDIKTKEDQIAADYQRLNTWFTENKDKLDEYGRIKPEYETLKAGGVKPPPPEPQKPAAGLTKEDIDKMLQERDAGYASVMAISTTLTAKHYKDFGEVLDMNALVNHAMKNHLPLYDPKADTDAYRALHGDKVAAKAKADEDARINKLVEDRIAEARKTQQQPFPIRGPEPSVLDALAESATDRTSKYSADAAAAHYAELTANSR